MLGGGNKGGTDWKLNKCTCMHLCCVKNERAYLHLFIPLHADVYPEGKHPTSIPGGTLQIAAVEENYIHLPLLLHDKTRHQPAPSEA